MTATIGAVPMLAPVGAVTPRLIRIPPAVRRIIRDVRLLNIPTAYRRKNWTGSRGQGSCVHAAFINLLQWQGEHKLADWWATHHANGETAESMAAKLEQSGLHFAETRSGDESFLEWAIRTRRGAGVVVQDGAHMVNLVGLTRSTAEILDSNHPDRIQHRPRDDFLNEWKESGGWAISFVGTPLPPDPWIIKTLRPPSINH
jgi:hypothetical protein